MVKDKACVSFLKKTLPKLNMVWSGFRKVRSQVCKRIKQRMQELALSSFSDYEQYLNNNPDEWNTLDFMFRITISRFYREAKMFDTIRKSVLPKILMDVGSHPNDIKCLVLGSASGEEPYTLSLIWENDFSQLYQHLSIEIIALEFDPYLIKRARKGCYPFSSLKELPLNWREIYFVRKSSDHYCLKKRYKNNVTFQQADIREKLPQAKYHIIFCRYLIATYYQREFQIQFFSSLKSYLYSCGFLVLGKKERLPNIEGYSVYSREERIYQKKRS